jgi:hypothetical protein
MQLFRFHCVDAVTGRKLGRPLKSHRERAVAGFAGRSHLFARSALFAGVAAAAVGFAAPAEAQGFFDVLRNIFGGGPPPMQRPAPPPLLLDGFPGGEVEQAPAEPGGPYVAYCVRLCDGRYFPLPRNAGSPSMNPQKVCSAMCPSAETKVFSGTNISRAVANDGKNYSSIKNAFLYREQTVGNCSCTGNGSTGVAAMDIHNDPTLRRGDIVVTGEGPKVFTGDSRPPHKPSDFVPADGYKGLPKSVRNELSGIRVSREPKTAAPLAITPAAIAPTVTPPDPLRPQASLSYSPAVSSLSDPVKSAFAAFQN